MNDSRQEYTRRLSQIDAFFMAYQERSGILMQLGGEAEIKGNISQYHVMTMLHHLVNRWHQLGQKLHRCFFGLAWRGEICVSEMLKATTSIADLHNWRNEPIDPFEDPPFQLLWISEKDKHTLAFRAHHAVTDGEAFFDIVIEALGLLAKFGGGKPIPASRPIQQIPMREIIKHKQILQSGKMHNLLKYMRWLAKEARADRSERLAMRACAPGDIAIWDHKFDISFLERLKTRASEYGTTPLWLFAAAWVRAIHAWNRRQNGSANPAISLEVPVSLRRQCSSFQSIGNFISPLTLFGDAEQPIVQLANHFNKKFVKEIRNRSIYAMPILSSPGRFLPWSLFRRVSVSPTSTGFATTHFTWLEQKRNIYAEVISNSDGKLALIDQKIYTPVCLRMGAALIVIAMPDRLQLFITYRLNALRADDVDQLAGYLMDELAGNGIQV